MPIVPDTFAAMPRWRSDEVGAAWVERLPDLVAEQCARWSLTLEDAAWHGSNALVLAVSRDGQAFALRMSPPNDDLRREVTALRFWAGHGVVQIAAADEFAGALLLERLDGDVTLNATPLDEAIPIVARLVSKMAMPAPADAPTTRAIASDESAHFRLATARVLGIPDAHLQAARDSADWLAGRECEHHAVDGDLHCDQIIFGSGGWTVVDPVLLRGDPEYDFARVLWRRLDEVQDAAHIRALVASFVDVAGVPHERAEHWIRVRSTSYLIWGLQHGLTEDPPRCRRLLAAFR